jgi:hypothetical protein
MSLYFVTYELRKDRDYDEIIEELEKFNATRVLNSHWCLKKENTSSVDLRDHFKNYIDSDDGLIVSKSTDWASLRTKSTPKNI